MRVINQSEHFKVSTSIFNSHLSRIFIFPSIYLLDLGLNSMHYSQNHILDTRFFQFYKVDRHRTHKNSNIVTEIHFFGFLSQRLEFLLQTIFSHSMLCQSFNKSDKDFDKSLLEKIKMRVICLFKIFSFKGGLKDFYWRELTKKRVRFIIKVKSLKIKHSRNAQFFISIEDY